MHLPLPHTLPSKAAGFFQKCTYSLKAIVIAKIGRTPLLTHLFYSIVSNSRYYGVNVYYHLGSRCAGSSGAVHSVFLIDVYLDLENPGGRDFG
jgi:hypothetical protein